MEDNSRYYSSEHWLVEDRIIQLYNIEGMRELSYLEYMELQELEKELERLMK